MMRAYTYYQITTPLIALVLLVRIPLTASAAAPPQARAVLPTPSTQDIELADGGVLVGRSVSSAGNPIAHQNIILQRPDGPPLATVTEADGSFRIEGLQAGCYQIVFAEQVQICRLWTAGSGPPCAGKYMLLSPQQYALRGQGPGSQNWAIAAGLTIAAGIALAVIGFATEQNASL